MDSTSCEPLRQEQILELRQNHVCVGTAYINTHLTLPLSFVQTESKRSLLKLQSSQYSSWGGSVFLR